MRGRRRGRRWEEVIWTRQLLYFDHMESFPWGNWRGVTSTANYSNGSIMGAGGSVPESAEDALAKGFTQEQIDEYVALQVGNHHSNTWELKLIMPLHLASMRSTHLQSDPNMYRRKTRRSSGICSLISRFCGQNSVHRSHSTLFTNVQNAGTLVITCFILVFWWSVCWWPSAWLARSVHIPSGVSTQQAPPNSKKRLAINTISRFITHL